jgi:polysaccharide biosynthesis/export protein
MRRNGFYNSIFVAIIVTAQFHAIAAGGPADRRQKGSSSSSKLVPTAVASSDDASAVETRPVIPSELSAPRPELQQPYASEYRIGPGDVLQIDVWKEPDAISPSIVVRPDGKISVPILGELQAAGLRPAELQELLSSKYSEFIRNARVTLTIREVHSQRVYLIGEVKREGPIRLQAPITVLQALAEAGGVTDYAKRKKIYVLRMVQDKQVMLPFDYDAVVRGIKVEQNLILAPGDTVIVPR